jgi:hypothetical protein
VHLKTWMSKVQCISRVPLRVEGAIEPLSSVLEGEPHKLGDLLALVQVLSDPASHMKPHWTGFASSHREKRVCALHSLSQPMLLAASTSNRLVTESSQCHKCLVKVEGCPGGP